MRHALSLPLIAAVLAVTAMKNADGYQLFALRWTQPTAQLCSRLPAPWAKWTQAFGGALQEWNKRTKFYLDVSASCSSSCTGVSGAQFGDKGCDGSSLDRTFAAYTTLDTDPNNIHRIIAAHTVFNTGQDAPTDSLADSARPTASSSITSGTDVASARRTSGF